eukprot:TRINITY_DN16912_c0_g1_i1.p1 TRINITY_DN16912_c0_g1~~TRINITY_DN16912_c0_g1_i1.p1  ORF type:complete len:114 (-),score=23.17 TRINITY_DN16912_c0_g1_i1:412-753(-)
MGNKLLVSKAKDKFADLSTFFIKYYRDITYVKVLRMFFVANVGNNKLFKTVLGTMESEGPLVIKVYMMNKENKELAEDFKKYKDELKRIQMTFNLITHPNVMPYQSLILDNVN